MIVFLDAFFFLPGIAVILMVAVFFSSETGSSPSTGLDVDVAVEGRSLIVFFEGTALAFATLGSGDNLAVFLDLTREIEIV